MWLVWLWTEFTILLNFNWFKYPHVANGYLGSIGMEWHKLLSMTQRPFIILLLCPFSILIFYGSPPATLWAPIQLFAFFWMHVLSCCFFFWNSQSFAWIKFLTNCQDSAQILFPLWGLPTQPEDEFILFLWTPIRVTTQLQGAPFIPEPMWMHLLDLCNAWYMQPSWWPKSKLVIYMLLFWYDTFIQDIHLFMRHWAWLAYNCSLLFPCLTPVLLPESCRQRS